jgi:hypothetical protein
MLPIVGSYTNLNHVFPKTTAIQSAVANGSYMIVDVNWELFYWDEGSQAFKLRADYLSQVNALANLFSGYEQYIGALSPLDEPYWRGTSQADLEAAITALKAAFPGKPIFLTFAYTEVYSLTSSTLPAGTDWIAFDKYSTNGGPIQMAQIQGYVNHLKSIKSSQQKLFLCPPSARNLDNVGYSDQQLADSINAFHTLMESDDEIIGMMVFPADGCRQVMFDGIGTTIPLAQAAQEAVGHAITGK